LQTFSHYFCYINACYKKNSQKAWKCHANCLYICLTKVILLPSEKKKLSRSRLTTDNWFSGMGLWDNSVYYQFFFKIWKYIGENIYIYENIWKYIEHFPNQEVCKNIYKLQTFSHYFCYRNACYKKMSKKAWKFHANCLYICLTKVILLPSEKKRLFSLVADSPQAIGFSEWDYETITYIISSSRCFLPKSNSQRQFILGNSIEKTSPSLANNK
jgi:hypothetical protein